MSRNRLKTEIQHARYLAGEMSMKEEIAFMNELKRDRKKNRALKTMEKRWKYFDRNPSDENWDAVKAWNRLHNRFKADGLLEKQPFEPAARSFAPAIRIAAAIILVITIGAALYTGLLKNNDGNPQETRYAGEGVLTVNLPDGSRVFLNKGSEVTYSRYFNQERSLTLKGEAFFEVMSDPVNPFTVHSGKVVVSVLGTSFNIKQHNHSSGVEVYVKSGKVRLSLEESGQSITLEPEEMVFARNRELTRLQQDNPNYLSWKTKDFKFVDAELMEVLKELEDAYHVKIHAERSALIDLKITTSYQGQSIDAILETIGTAFGLTVTSKKEGYYLTN